MSTALPRPHSRLRGGRLARRDRRSRRRGLRLRMIGTPAIAALVVAIGATGFVRAWEAQPAVTVVSEPVPAPVTSEPTAEEVMGAAAAAVEAWGRFATSGDLGEVDDHFVRDGPQYRQFEQEAGARQAAAGGPPYRFTLLAPVLLDDQPEGDRIVRGELELTRDGEPAQRFRWDLRLRRGEDGAWRVWTVLEAADG